MVKQVKSLGEEAQHPEMVQQVVGADPRDPVRERALDIDVPKGTRGKSGLNREDIPGAEERLLEDAMTVASERAQVCRFVTCQKSGCGSSMTSDSSKEVL